MKYCVLIIDGASGLPLPQHGGKTSLELARTPNLDAMAPQATLGLVRTVPQGMEPSSACACMSVLGYDPTIYYKGRSAIEARSMGITFDDGDAVFRCNLVSVDNGIMRSYSSGYISTEEARELIEALNQNLGSDVVHFYPGVSYRHICRLKGRADTLSATCTPPHDIPDKPVADFLPRGPGSEMLRELMSASEAVLRDHPVNVRRRSNAQIPATMIWLFWGSSQLPDMPAFQKVYGLRAAMTSAVDLLRGLARMVGMAILDISGVTDGLDNDYAAQAAGAMIALNEFDLAVIHIEAPDEAGHAGSVDDKIEAIQRIDREVVGRFRSWQQGSLRLLIMPDHPTPIQVQTHTGVPVPFMLWGPGFAASGARRFTEAEAKRTRLFVDPGFQIMRRLLE
jgi:2,3-bisphosphoglycerate-independent phosphoglycerate mutase